MADVPTEINSHRATDLPQDVAEAVNGNSQLQQALAWAMEHVPELLKDPREESHDI